MAGLWDSIMKRLVKTYAPHFTNWLLAEATFVRSLNVELQSQQLYADALIEVSIDEEPGLLLIEFQSYRDPEMGRRLAEYSIIASREHHHCEVYSYVIYLRRVGEIDHSPYIRMHRDGWEEYRFHFRMVQLWEMPAEFFLGQGWLGILPLAILAKGGKRPAVVNQMIEQLTRVKAYDLLALARLLGGLVFKEGTDESDWFQGRFHMFQDILRESWVYQEIGQEYFAQGREQGLEQGFEKGREERLQGQREMLLSFVQRDFPEVLILARQQVNRITDPELVQAVFLKLVHAQTVEEAKKIFFELDTSTEKH